MTPWHHGRRHQVRLAARRSATPVLVLESLEPRFALNGDGATTTPGAFASSDGSLPRFDIGSPQLVDLWVDPTRGNDAVAGRSRAEPLRTLSEAWRRVPVGMPLAIGYRINLLPGTYPESAVPNYWERRYGTATSPVILAAADGAGTVRLPSLNIFDCRSLYLVGLWIEAGGGDVLHFERCENVLLRDTTVRGTGNIASYASPQEALKANQSRHIYIENCDISGGWDNAIDFVAVQHGHVVGSRIHRAGDWAMYAKGGSAHLTIAGNVIFDAGTGGFTAGQGTGFEFMVAPYLTFEASDIRFVHNVVHDTQGAGFGVNGGSNILMAHNTLYRVGARSHVIEVVHGSRSCDGDVATCSRYLAAGGWGTNVPGGDEPIPSENIFIFNNVVLNPDGYVSQWQHFTVATPRTPSIGSNIPSPARADTNLQIRGNVIWNGTAGHSLGIDAGPLAADILANNAINTLRPVLVDPAGGDYRFAPSFSLPNPVPLPTLPDGNPPPVTPPPASVPPGIATFIVPAGRIYRPGEPLVFTAVMTEPVVVTGMPSIRIVIGSTSRLARFSGGSGTSTLTFTYTVTRKDRDADGIAVLDSIRLPAGARILTLRGAVVATAFSAGDTSGIRVEPPPRIRAGRR